MGVGENESEDLRIHVAACDERYKTLFNATERTNKRLDRIEGFGLASAGLIILKLLAVVGFLVVILLRIPEAKAQLPCGDRHEIVAALRGGFGERQTAVGLSGGGALIELYVSAAGTWTILATMPGGATCILRTGEAWETVSAATAPCRQTRGPTGRC